MNNIEVELKLIISDDKYDKLKEFFNKQAEFITENKEETHYLDCKEDIRLYKSDTSAKICLKQGGDCHDQIREETELKFSKEQFSQAEKIFNSLGYKAEIKWFRKRIQYKWENINAMLDKTKGYANILELEIVTTKENQNKALEELKQKAKQLELEITPKQEFKTRYNYYKENWQQLTK